MHSKPKQDYNFKSSKSFRKKIQLSVCETHDWFSEAKEIFLCPPPPLRKVIKKVFHLFSPLNLHNFPFSFFTSNLKFSLSRVIWRMIYLPSIHHRHGDCAFNIQKTGERKLFRFYGHDDLHFMSLPGGKLKSSPKTLQFFFSLEL